MNAITKFAISALVFSAVLLPLKYEEDSLIINEKPENIYCIDVDMNSDLVEVQNKLSFDKLYGFQTMSEMVGDADYAVNGMFYDTLGKPYGSIIEDGEVVQLMEMDAPMLVIDYSNKASIVDGEFSFIVRDDLGKDVDIDCVNSALYDGQWGFFNSYNGNTTRVSGEATSYILRDGVVVDKKHEIDAIDIPESCQILVKRGEDLSFKKNYRVHFKLRLDLEEGGFIEAPLYVDEKENFKAENHIKTLFTLGAWLVKNGENVAEEYNPFIGPTITNQPRTMVGLTEDNHLIFIVVDGRSDESLGVSGSECAEILLKYGVINGGYLDGGASSEVMAGSKVLNNPSAGEERKIAHAIAIYDTFAR